MTEESIDITPSPRLLEVLGDIPLQPWQCLAELIDNSLDEISRGFGAGGAKHLHIDISFHEAKGRRELIVRDNGLGMSRDELIVAVKAGATSKGRFGTLGLFGMGFNIATARLGRTSSVTTSRAGDSHQIRTTIDFSELQRREQFVAPLELISKEDREDSGTEIRVSLKPEQADYFWTDSNRNILRDQLGNVYSYLLRSEIPGISADGLSAPAPVVITLDGKTVKPKLPCIWSDTRSVQSYGQAVSAVQYVDIKLTDATACMACGFWDRQNGPEACRECGSEKLEVRSRRIWGWLGVQRYIDSSHFGIDFLRFGRKILIHDKSLFKFTDPDTLREDVEYPIEMPANQGRLVGEIHLDHVAVTYQKNDFDRQSRDWDLMVRELRGTDPMKARSARQVNGSVLARLYSAFRRNDPGLKCLIAGDGKRAIHSKAREWAGLFEKEVPRYVPDTIWFEAAQRHDAGESPSDEVSPDGVGSSGSGDLPSGEGSREPGSGALRKHLGPDHGDAPDVEPAPRGQTRAEQLESAMALAVERSDLSGDFRLGDGLGDWNVLVRETPAQLNNDAGQAVPAVVATMAGGVVEVLVHKESPLFKDFGRDVRDVALIEVAQAICSLTNSDKGVTFVYSALVQQIDDLRASAASIQDAAESVLQTVAQMMLETVADDPSRYWDQLDAQSKRRVELRAATEHPTVALRDLVDDGRFFLLLDGRSLGVLVEFDPLRFFDNGVFRAAFEQRPDEARRLLVRRTVRLIDGLGEFLDDQNARLSEDLALAQVQIETLRRQLRSYETV